ncbi:MAG: hypothetical protein R3F11_24515 [Verrucomicrobiales bacterium]
MRNKLIPALFTGLTLAAPLAATADILEDSGGKTGRYLLIENNGNVSRQLHMSEVEAFLWGITPAAGYDNANDQALSGSGASATIASGPLQHGTLGALLDGSPQSGAATFSLNPGVGNGVLVDLGAEMELGEVRLWQRADGCCQDRLSNVSVSLWDDNGGSPGNEVFSGVIPGQLPTNSNGSVDLSSKTVRPGGAGAIGTDTMEGAYISGIRATTTGTADPSQFFHIGEIEAFVAGQPRAAGPGIDPASMMWRSLPWARPPAPMTARPSTGLMAP